MAEVKEIFHILDDGSGDGAGLREVNEGQVLAGTENGALGFSAKNSSNEAHMLNLVAEGEAVATSNVQTVLACKDDAGQSQYIPMIGNAIRVTTEGAKTHYSGEAQITVVSAGAEEQVLEVTIGAVGTTYDDVELLVSSFKDCTWKVYHVDDVGGTETETLLLRARSGAGQYTPAINLSCLNLDTTGGSNTQAIRVKVIQRAGTGSDASAFLCIKSNE